MLLLAGASNVSAQPDDDIEYKTEKRIFLWDVTISMVGATQHQSHINDNGIRVDNVKNHSRVSPDYRYNEVPYVNYNSDADIFDATREKLLELIENIDDERTEILVVPYTDGVQAPMWVPSATNANKAALKKMVMSWNNLKQGRTYTGQSLRYVIDNYFDANKINRVVLLTDGEPHESDRPILMAELAQWDCRNKEEKRYYNNRLVYVMLNKEAEAMKPYLDHERGTDGITSDEDPTKYLSFRIGNRSFSLHLNELSESGALSRWEGVVNCKPSQSNFIGAGVKMRVECEENPYIFLEEKIVSVDDEGQFVVKVCFKEEDRQFYSEELGPQGGVGKVYMTCSVFSTENGVNATLEGIDKIEVNLVARPEPRVTLSLSTK